MLKGISLGDIQAIDCCNEKHGTVAWVWPAECGASPNQYVQFRHEFVLERIPEHAVVRICCDSNYALWLDGEFINCGLFHSYPDHKHWDDLPVSNLRIGRNVLAIVVHYQGEGSFQYIKGEPGLVYALDTGDAVIASGRETRYRVDPGYVQGPVPRITPQLGFTFEYNAVGDDKWREVGYDEADAWSTVSDLDLILLEQRPVAAVRPLPKLVHTGRVETRALAQGLFCRQRDDGTAAEAMLSDYLRPLPQLELFEGKAIRRDMLDGADGAYVVLDLGREEAGFLELDIEAAAGTVIDIAWGEHLNDMRVRSRIGTRNFASRYVCRNGRQRFVHYFTRLAGRYLQLHISRITRDFVVHYAGLIGVEYPIEMAGTFTCADRLHQRIYDTSVRTLHLCMYEHYEDCPWREQALYAMDMRNQALAGYYCFGEYEFPKVSLDLLARGLKPDAFLELCAPAEIDITIPVFTMAWILAVADHYRYSGDIDAVRLFMPTIETILYKRAQTTANGLLPCPTGPRYWHFYDWASGLDGCAREDCTRFAVLDDIRYDAPLNMFYCLALEDAAELALAVGAAEVANAYRTRCNAVRHLIHERFWDNADRSYVTFSGGNAPLHRSELVQALAILSRVCDWDRAKVLRERLALKDNGLVETTLSHSYYKFEALLTDPAYGPNVFDSIARDWGHMLYHGATSFWETLKGGDDFDGAGSLCHGWSGIPVFFYHAYVLGIKPTAPGFSEFARNPNMGLIGPVRGIVPTPRGLIDLPDNATGRNER